MKLIPILCACVLAVFAGNASADASLDISAWARASIAGSANGAVYGSFTNTGTKPIAVVGVSTPVASMAMIHETVTKDGMVSMRPVAALDIPAGKTVECKPGGCHIMLMGLKQSLDPGSKFTLSVNLDDGSTVEVAVVVGGIGQMTAP